MNYSPKTFLTNDVGKLGRVNKGHFIFSRYLMHSEIINSFEDL